MTAGGGEPFATLRVRKEPAHACCTDRRNTALRWERAAALMASLLGDTAFVALRRDRGADYS
jgi:hypothetical protein